MDKKLFMLVVATFILVINCTQGHKTGQQAIEKEIKSDVSDIGDNLYFEFTPGKHHNHPTFAIWIEDLQGNYIHPIFVTKSVSSGIWGHGELEPGKWKDQPGRAVRTAALPYWFHQRGDGTMPAIPDEEYALPDAITAATPESGFYLEAKSGIEKGKPYQILLEINQTWDWNDYWHNNKYPDDIDYKTSCQPALVYAVTINPDSDLDDYYFNPIGHSHYSGKNGNLYTDLSTFTTALEIFDKIKVTVK